MGLRDQLRRLKRDASRDAVLVYQRDGTVRAFPKMDAHIATFLLGLELYKGVAYQSPVIEAVRNATSESRREFEERFGSITPTARVICPECDGGWVEEFNLLEDGTIQRNFYEGGSEEAKRVLEEARQGGPGSF